MGVADVGKRTYCCIDRTSNHGESMKDFEEDDLDLQETDVPNFQAPRRGRPEKKKEVVAKPGQMPLHLRPASHATIYVAEGATMGPHKVNVPKRKSDTVMF